MRFVTLLCSTLLLGSMMTLGALNARADVANRDTMLTFSQPIEIPGMVLSAGTYEFRLADPMGNDTYLVEVLNSKGDGIALVQASPDYRAKVSDKTVVTFEERGPGNPEAIKAWFYPDSIYGLEFYYPKSQDQSPR